MGNYGLIPRPTERPGVLVRLFGGKRKGAAFTEVWNLVATVPIAQIPASHVAEILARHKVETSDLKADLLTLYGTILREACRDDELSDDELVDLRRLASLFGLGDADLRDLTTQTYQARLALALADDRYADDERVRMKALSERLQLPPEMAAAAMKEKGSALLWRVLEGAIADRKLAPDEEKHLYALARQLGIAISVETATARMLDRFRLYWRIEQGDLPKLDTPLRLRRGEQCHFQTAATHLERRTVTRSIRYSGPSARLRIARGVYWRVGSITPKRVTEEVLVPLDSGTLYITSQRLLFDGSKKSTTIQFGKIVNFQLLQDGMIIEKDSGKDQVFQVGDEVELAGMVLNAALAGKD